MVDLEQAVKHGFLIQGKANLPINPNVEASESGGYPFEFIIPRYESYSAFEQGEDGKIDLILYTTKQYKIKGFENAGQVNEYLAALLNYAEQRGVYL